VNFNGHLSKIFKISVDKVIMNLTDHTNDGPLVRVPEDESIGGLRGAVGSSVNVHVVVVKTPQQCHQTGSDLSLSHCSSGVPAASFFFFFFFFFKDCFSSSHSTNDTVRLRSLRSVSIYNKASYSGTDSLSARSRGTDYTHTHSHTHRNVNTRDSETRTTENRRKLWKGLNLFLASVAVAMGIQEVGLCQRSSQRPAAGAGGGATGAGGGETGGRGGTKEEEEDFFSQMENPAVVSASHIVHRNIPTL